jgi:hypothetical protein
MGLLLAVSGLAASLASYWLLRLGLFSMALRYPLAAVAGYLVFIVILRLWVRFRHAQLTSDDSGLGDALELSFSTGTAEVDSISDGVDSGWDVDDAVFIAVLIALAVSLAVVLGFVLIEAPALFAEVIVDSALVTALYKRMAAAAEGIWMERVISHTWTSFALVALISAASGWAAQQAAPGEATLGAVIHALTEG